MKTNTGELILYQPESSSDFHLEVRVEDETVWLNRHQLADLFDRDVKTIGKHIGNALKEELKEISVVAKFATTGNDGKVYQVEHYNLDMTISVGYRVKSNRGVQFRMWANSILKEYLLKGYSVNNRLDKIEQKISEHDQQFEFFLKTSLPPQEGIFYDGQIFDAWDFSSDLIKTAQKSILLLDNYIDNTTLTLLSKRKENTKTTIYTREISKQLAADIQKYKVQYGEIEVNVFTKSHDRFLIIDEKTVYHIGASLKDLGKKWFAFSKINLDPQELIQKLKNQT